MSSPLSLDDAKEHLKVDGDDDDGVIEAAIAAAVGHVERFTGLLLTRRAVTETLPCFGDRLRSWPVHSVTSVGYLGEGGVSIDLAAGSWWANLLTRPLRLSSNSRWPILRTSDAHVVVTMDAGYDGASSVPAEIVQALKILTGHFYHDREGAGEIPAAVAALLRPYRLRRL